MGHLVSPETRAKLSSALIGHVDSEATRAKMSAAWIGKTGSLARRWKGGRAVSIRKGHAKHRLLGFYPLNSWFPGCHAHHINNDDVIHMPHDLHNSVRHNQYTGMGMAAINVLAGAFLTEDWT
jgi:hypothetical protein